MRRISAAVVGRLKGIGESDNGMVAIWTALLMVVLLGMAALSVDIARWYVEAQRLQKTVDAAALAGVVYMPQNLAQAQASADKIIQANGWDLGQVTVDKQKDGGGSRFRVTMSSKVINNFGAVIGQPSSTITRTAVADFRPPAPLGSPCNVHGNEPNTGSGSALPSPTPANCSSTPQFWSTMTGPEVFKVQGDRYSARRCEGGESGCAGTANTEFDPRGYVMAIKVRERLSGPLTVEIYDPAYVDTGQQCEELPGRVSDMSRCTGDDDNTGLRYPEATENPTVTSFGLLKPNDSLDPFAASSNEPSDWLCYRQFPGYAKEGPGEAPWRSNPGVPVSGGSASQQMSADSGLSSVLQQWVSFCTIRGPVPAGDYYLRIRTNVAWGNPTGVFSQIGDNWGVSGNGSNRFSVRAVPANVSERGKVQVSPYTRMPIFANSDASKATFNLIRVLPSTAGQEINFSFFDVGDAAESGTMQVLAPVESTYQAKGCKKDGKENGNADNCSISGIKNSMGWDGQSQRMSIPVPADYTCNVNDPFGCWWRLKVDFTSGAVHDQTTWTATLDGDPVRIVE